MALDEELLARRREEQSDAADEEAVPEDSGRDLSLRESIMAARRQQDSGNRPAVKSGGDIRAARRISLNQKGEGAASVASLIENPAKNGLSQLLQKAWLNVIDSFGLTLLWVNVHAFMHNINGSLFCDLGEEWASGSKLGSAKSLDNQGVIDKVSKRFGWLEKGLLIAVDFLVFLVLLAAAVLIILLVRAIMDPLHNLGLIFGFLFGK